MHDDNYKTHKYYDLIKSELKIDNWIFLSKYIIFEPNCKRKFIIKDYIIKNTRWIIKNLKILQKEYAIKYEKFKTKYNIDIYPYVFNSITDDEILYYFKYCCNHDFLPNILLETDSFLEIEYLDLLEWRFTTPFERSLSTYFKCVNSYCSHICDLKLCLVIESHNHNIMINKKTGKFKNIDIEDLWPPNHFIPNICWFTTDIHKEFSAHYTLRTNYSFSTEMFNKSFEYYKDLLEVINLYRIHSKKKLIYCTNNYKNLPHEI
jgi:hypothetical protein